MSEIISTPPFEALPQPVRLEYGAVPLNPWTAVELDRKGFYSVASLRRIDRKISSAFDDAREKKWVESPELADELQRFVAESLYDSQMRRIDFNPTLPMGVIDDDNAQAIEAKNGTATPKDLLELLIEYPQLGSLELAKLSHPLDAHATIEMETAVFAALEDAREVIAPPTYKMKRKNLEIPAGIVLRKQCLFELSTINGMISVIELKSLLVRGDDEANDSKNGYTHRKIKNNNRFDELKNEIDASMQIADLKWLQPIATSYYARYPGEKILTSADD